MGAEGKDPADQAPFTDDYLLYLLAHVSAAASEDFHAELERDGIPISTWRVMTSLFPDKQLNVGTLARMCFLKQPTLTRILDRLAKQGLVERIHAETDRRGVLIGLTAQGQDLARNNIDKARAHERSLLGGFSAENEAALKQQLRDLLTRFRQR